MTVLDLFLFSRMSTLRIATILTQRGQRVSEAQVYNEMHRIREKRRAQAQAHQNTIEAA